MKGRRVDKPLLVLIGALLVGGLFIFSSAVFGFLARGATNTSSVVFSHVVLGVGGGLIALIIAANVDYKIWKKFAPYLFLAAIVFTALVFVPGIGFEHGGCRCWAHFAGFSVQPSEFLKAGTILMAAAYFSAFRMRVHDFRWGLGGLFALLAAPGLLLAAQPDLGTLGIVVIAVTAIFFAAGARYRDLLISLLIGILVLAAFAYVKPHVLERIETFLNPAQNPQAEGYQIRQSLIAIGSGGLFGRGFGQGVQKFTYLPEPIGDSIFAVASEEFGFVGALALIGTFLALALRGFAVAARAPDSFGALLAVGVSTYLVAEAFINIGAMLGLAPLTGIPLTFISQGGSAMLASLGCAGILLAVSRQAKRA